jgi:hypothetical protein
MSAIFFDPRWLPPDAQARATDLAVSFVRGQMKPEDIVAILAWDGNAFQVKEDFTADRDRLVNAIRQAPSGNPEAFDAIKQMEGLRAAIERLGSLAGKKALIYFHAHDLHTPGPDELRSVIDAAVRGNVALYPIDTSAPAGAPFGH